MRKIKICAFGSHHIKKGFPRFVEQAKSMQIFDEIITWDETYLDSDFKKIWGRYLVRYSRGFGYWCWKPYFILKELEKLEDGDILLYTDIGCFLRPEGRKRFDQYIQMTLDTPSGILACRYDVDPNNELPATIYYENNWTKGDVFDYFNVIEDRDFTHSTQFASGIIFFKKSDLSVKFVKEWYQAYLDNYNLATDAPSHVPNFSDFIENRHDQSIFSMLAKKYKIASISASETSQTNWELISNYPIWAMRDKAYPTKLHYRFRFKLRKFHQKWWKVKYFFKDLF